MSHALVSRSVKILLMAFGGVGLLAPAALAGVDPALLALVPADAKLLVGIQVSQTQASPFGQYLLAQDLLSQLDRGTNQILTARLRSASRPARDSRRLRRRFEWLAAGSRNFPAGQDREGRGGRRSVVLEVPRN